MKKTKIKFGPEKYWVEVRLYNTIQELRKQFKDEKEAEGLYRPEPFTVYPKLKIPDKMGIIYLAKEKLGVGYITHEVLHCIFDYAHKILRGNQDTLDLDNNEDLEKLCWRQGYITKEICNWLYKIKIW